MIFDIAVALFERKSSIFDRYCWIRCVEEYDNLIINILTTIKTVSAIAKKNTNNYKQKIQEDIPTKKHCNTKQSHFEPETTMIPLFLILGQLSLIVFSDSHYVI